MGYLASLIIGYLAGCSSMAYYIGKLKKQDVHISSKDLYRFMKAVRCYKKAHPDWLLAEVNSADGERISVIL